MLQRTEQILSARLEDLGALLGACGARSVLIVVDRNAIEAAQLDLTLTGQLAPFRVAEFDGFSPNPTVEQGAAAARLAHGIQADAVAGIGGGSCLDVAKIAALGARNPAECDKLAAGLDISSAEPLPIIAAPSTSGTGSEATHFAAVYVDGQKVSVAHPRMRPAAVVLDRRLHESMPPGLAASSGLDALAQAMESLWAVGGGADSVAYAETGGRLIARSIEQSVLGGTPEARVSMMLGAHLAGQAINLGKTTAAHALSYALTHSFGIPHGHAVALTLGWVGLANSRINEKDCQDPRGPAYVRGQVALAASLLGVDAQALPAVVSGLMKRLGLAHNLREAGVPRDALGAIAASIDPVRLGNNPKRLDPGAIAVLLDSAWGAS